MFLCGCTLNINPELQFLTATFAGFLMICKIWDQTWRCFKMIWQLRLSCSHLQWCWFRWKKFPVHHTSRSAGICKAMYHPALQPCRNYDKMQNLRSALEQQKQTSTSLCHSCNDGGNGVRQGLSIDHSRWVVSKSAWEFRTSTSPNSQWDAISEDSLGATNQNFCRRLLVLLWRWQWSKTRAIHWLKPLSGEQVSLGISNFNITEFPIRCNIWGQTWSHKPKHLSAIVGLAIAVTMEQDKGYPLIIAVEWWASRLGNFELQHHRIPNKMQYLRTDLEPQTKTSVGNCWSCYGGDNGVRQGHSIDHSRWVVRKSTWAFQTSTSPNSQ